MKLPLQITTRKFTLTESIENAVQQKVKKLEQFSDQIIACRVMVETPHRHKHQGVLYNIRLDLTMPGGEIVVKREPHEDIYVAIRDTFDAARRQLLAFNRRRRGEVKRHQVAEEGNWDVDAEYPMAKVAKLYNEQGYGFLETPDGEEVYFASQNLVGLHFDQLQVGELVRFAAKNGQAGLQAKAVTSR